jgi:integrase
MATNKLTELQCRKARPGKHFDGEGMFLLVDNKLRRYWRMKYRRPKDGKEDTLAFGVYPIVSLQEARAERKKAKDLIRLGKDPKAEARAVEEVAARAAADEAARKQNVYSLIVEAWYEASYRPWSATHRRDVRRILDKELIPTFGKRPVADIDASELDAMFEKISNRGALTFARDVLMYFRKVWKYTNAQRVKNGLNELPDPSRYVALLAPPDEKHHAALAPQEIGAFLRTLEHSDAGAVVRIAVRMLLLTAVRTTELRAAVWGEFDTKEARWRIPAERMKADRGHIVPLSRQALALLTALRSHTGSAPYLFPNGRDDYRPMSENAILAALKRMGYKGRLTGHGMRSMFSTWAHEAGYPSDAIERQLAHAPADKVKAAYLRSEFLELRAKMMQAWADWLDASAATADVIPLRQAG